MMIFGRRLSEYVQYCKVFLIFIAAVGIARLALSLGGAPIATAKWFSITAASTIGTFYYAVRVHRSGFGSYKQLLVIYVLLNIVSQAVIISGILLAIFTGARNIFSAPEYAFGSDGATWIHAGAHLLIGTVAGSLGPWAIGSLVMFVTRKLAPSDAKT